MEGEKGVVRLIVELSAEEAVQRAREKTLASLEARVKKGEKMAESLLRIHRSGDLDDESTVKLTVDIPEEKLGLGLWGKPENLAKSLALGAIEKSFSGFGWEDLESEVSLSPGETKIRVDGFESSTAMWSAESAINGKLRAMLGAYARIERETRVMAKGSPKTEMDSRGSGMPNQIEIEILAMLGSEDPRADWERESKLSGSLVSFGESWRVAVGMPEWVETGRASEEGFILERITEKLEEMAKERGVAAEISAIHGNGSDRPPKVVVKQKGELSLSSEDCARAISGSMVSDLAAGIKLRGLRDDADSPANEGANPVSVKNWRDSRSSKDQEAYKSTHGQKGKK